jgi:hypothetical protein
VATPVLVLGESWCLKGLSRTISYLRSSGIVRPEDHNTFEAHVASTARGLQSIWAEVFALLLTYLIVFAFFIAVFPAMDVPKWHIHQQQSGVYSAAGYWHLLVSMPLLILLLLGWVWRHLMWWRLPSAGVVSRSDIRSRR